MSNTLKNSIFTMRGGFRAAALIAVTLAGATIATASPASAGWNQRYGWSVGAGVAAGVVGGLALGAIASRSYVAPYYSEPVYDGCYPVRQKVWTAYGWRTVRRIVCE